ncbi:acyltransferase family protein [Microbacterium karelineae]|uniref:acyltransferase family protein n=1 Tax=Microbacterium karelineae TaxID=2654283 RepID=UPI0012E9E87F|nr:acyltransferase [Microbacterium karelineae]
MAAVTHPHDASIDVLRAACTIVVVALHATMAGVIVTGGQVSFDNALEEPWFAPVSWLVQIMPLFFLAGGATAAVSFRRGSAGSASGFVARRVQRLLGPAFAATLAIAVSLAALGAVGVPDALVEEAGFRLSQPLWFLGVFLLVQSLVPTMLRAHDRHPVASLVAILAAVVAVDVTRAWSGIEGVGFANLLFVWLLMQQLGFLLADGRFAAHTVRARLGLAAGALMITASLALAGAFSPDMYTNLNPPTSALVLLGFAQACVFSVLQPALRGLALRPRIGAVTGFVNRRAMEIYLWHMPAIVGLAGLLVAAALVAGAEPAAVHSPAWWATRPAWIAAVAAATLVLVHLVTRRPIVPRAATSSPWRAAGGSVLAVASIGVVFVLGLDVEAAVISLTLAAAAMRLTRGTVPVGVTRSGAAPIGGYPPMRMTSQSDAAVAA